MGGRRHMRIRADGPSPRRVATTWRAVVGAARRGLVAGGAVAGVARRVVAGVAPRGLVVLGVIVGAMVPGAVSPTAAQAHVAVDVTVHSDGSGVVWITISWSDRHPVTERATAIMLALSEDGDRVGPVALTTVPDRPGEARYAEVLGPGRWQVTVDVAEPAVGHCVADVRVAGRGRKAVAETKVCLATHAPSPPA